MNYGNAQGSFPKYLSTVEYHMYWGIYQKVMNDGVSSVKVGVGDNSATKSPRSFMSKK